MAAFKVLKHIAGPAPRRGIRVVQRCSKGIDNLLLSLRTGRTCRADQRLSGRLGADLGNCTRRGRPHAHILRLEKDLDQGVERLTRLKVAQCDNRPVDDLRLAAPCQQTEPRRPGIHPAAPG